MKKIKSRKETIRNGFRACLEGELELLEEASRTGKDFDSQNYFDTLRIVKRRLHIPEKELRKYEAEYYRIIGSYWENIKKKGLN